MTERPQESSTEYGIHKGLFGETDRRSGEYHFKSGYTQQVYSNARYAPADESTAPPRYYKPVDGHASSETVKRTAAKRKKTGFGFLMILLLCVCCALVGGIVGAMLMSSYFENRITALENNVFESEEMAGEMLADKENAVLSESVSAESGEEELPKELSASEIYDLACEEVVSINTEYYYVDRSGYTIPSVVSGSGFVVSSDGYIITNYHVVEKAADGGFEVAVSMMNGSTYSGRVVGFDKFSDIALLKIDAPELIPVTIGDSEEVKVGDEIYAVGNPFGILDFTLTTGRVSALDRLIATENNEDNAIRMFQIDAAVYEGNSGGPIYNSYGEVIGIVAAKYAPQVESEGIGFAIPINSAMKIISGIVDTGYVASRAELGITFDNRYNTMYSKYYGLPAGAYVYEISRGSCAETAGILPGDIITKIGPMDIDDCEDIRRALKAFRAGDQASVVLFRNGEILIAWVVFDKEI